MSSNPYADWARRKAGKMAQPARPPAQAPAHASPAPAAAPQVPPYAAPPVRAGSWAQQRPAAPHATIPRPETNVLVKPGPSFYEDWIATVPDVVGPSGYDAMDGNISPDSAKALQEAGIGVAPSPNPDAPTRAYHANAMPATKATGLR